MNDPSLPASIQCPMCGESIAAVAPQCPACGEPLLAGLPIESWRDFALAMSIGAVSCGINGYFAFYAIRAVIAPPVGPHSFMERDLAVISAVLVMLWLWPLPVLASLVGDPQRKKKGLPVSRWRLFWQTQGIMYAVSVGLFFLCLVTCATR
jgi:hypothetical protein